MEQFVFDLQRFEDINNYSNDTLISGTKNYDYIYNNSSNVTINAKAGDDSIESWYGSNSTINAGAGNDSIQIYGG